MLSHVDSLLIIKIVIIVFQMRWNCIISDNFQIFRQVSFELTVHAVHLIVKSRLDLFIILLEMVIVQRSHSIDLIQLMNSIFYKIWSKTLLRAISQHVIFRSVVVIESRAQA